MGWRRHRTLDISGYSSNQVINLNAGSFSNIGGRTGNVSIALGATIENAIGGSGNDTLIANNFGSTLRGGAGNDGLTGGTGSDVLVGGTGKDTFAGGGGSDTFLFVAGDSGVAINQRDLITDFTVGVDLIDFSGFDVNPGSGVGSIRSCSWATPRSTERPAFSITSTTALAASPFCRATPTVTVLQILPLI